MKNEQPQYVITFQKISSIFSLTKPKICVGGSIGDGTAFVGKKNGHKAFLKTINKLESKYFWGYDFVFADTLYSHNLTSGNDVIRNEQAKKILDDWLVQNDFSIKDDMLYYKGLCVTKKGRIFRWDTFRNNKECQKQLEELRKLYFLEENQCIEQRTIEKHKDFLNGINETLEERKEAFKKQNKVVEDKEILAYLLEEYAVLVWMAKTKGINIFHYPSEEPAGFAATRRCFLDDSTLLNYSKITIGKKTAKIEKKKRREKRLELKNKINKQGEVFPQKKELLKTEKEENEIYPLEKNSIKSTFFTYKGNTQSILKINAPPKIENNLIEDSLRKMRLVTKNSCNNVLKKYPNDFNLFVDALLETIEVMRNAFKKETEYKENPKTLKNVVIDLYIDQSLAFIWPILDKAAVKNGGFTGSPSSPKGKLSVALFIGYLQSNMHTICKQIVLLLDQNIPTNQIDDTLQQLQLKTNNERDVLVNIQESLSMQNILFNKKGNIIVKNNILNLKNINVEKNNPITASIKQTIYNNMEVTGVTIVKKNINDNDNW